MAIQFIAPNKGLGTAIRIVKNIKAGEELFVDYGEGYFDPCPCITCVPPLIASGSTSQPNENETDDEEKRPTKKPKQEINGEEQRLAKNAKKALKRQRKKEGKGA